jgi:endonuclease/exonuclease/phosphatase family metal-dependent hydrolase
MESTIGNFLTNLPPSYGVDLPKLSDFTGIRMVSYNIYSPLFGPKLPRDLENPKKREGDPSSGFDPSRAWMNRMPIILQMILKVEPDVLLLQELSPPQMFELRDQLGLFGYELVAYDSEEGRTPKELEMEKPKRTYLGLGIAFRKDRFSCVVSKPVQLFLDGFCVMWAQLEEKQLRRTILVMNAHFLLRCARATNLRFCIDLAEQLSPKDAWILGGDLNYFQSLEAEQGDGTLFLKCANQIRQAGVSHWTETEQGHYGQPCTYIGFPADFHRTPIADDGVPASICPDHFFYKRCDGAVCSFSLAGEYDEETFELVTPLCSLLKQSRYIASDHCLIGIDLVLNSFLTHLPLRYDVDLPEVNDPKIIRMSSYNVYACHENKQHGPFVGSWNMRREIIRQMIEEKVRPDIVAFQELSPMQAVDLRRMLNNFELISCNIKNLGLGIAFRKERFSLVLHPSSYEDQVMWVKLEERQLKQSILVMNAHFPIGGESFRSLETCIQLVNQLSPHDPWIFGGDLNYFREIEKQNGFGTLFLQTMTTIVQSGATYWTETEDGHYGQPCTFIGFENDAYKTPITDAGVPHPVCPDHLLHKGFKGTRRSFSLAGEYDDKFLELVTPLCAPVRQERCIASDHCLIGMDLMLEKKQLFFQKLLSNK